MTVLRVGLTGGLAAGKSTVGGLLRDEGLLVVDADRLVAELYAPGAEGARAVAGIFGPEALDASGAVDRAFLATRVFTDDEARARLETAVHPLVRERFESLVRNAEAGGGDPTLVAVLEATLLVEAGFGPWFDLIVTVEAPERLRLRRAVERGLSGDDARRRLEAQGTGAARRAAAHRVVWNHTDPAALATQVEALAGELRARAEAGSAPGDLLRGAVLVTGNAGKLAEARRLAGADLESVDLDLPEIQSLDLLEVLAEKGREAWRRLQRPLIVEETGFGLAALGGFPGPLVKWMLEAIGPEGISRTADALGERGATARCALLYLDGERQILADAAVPGRVVSPPRGGGGFGWDPVFEPAGQDRTYGELPAEIKDRISHRSHVWRQLAGKIGG